MSRALARLRALPGGPLQVRAAGGFVLAPRAQGFAPEVAAALADLRRLFQPPPLDPEREARPVLAASGVTRRIPLTTAHFMAAVAVTGLVTTIWAAFPGRYATVFDLVLRPPPFAVLLIWSRLPLYGKQYKLVGHMKARPWT